MMKLKSLRFLLNLSVLLIGCFNAKQVTAQIIPDNTLPENSQVQLGCLVCEIRGGTIKNLNLFHSFKQFSVPTNGQAVFSNNLEIKNIFTRVTGNDVSSIDGLIRTQGNANLFFINPHGIIFGDNAVLDINGSFIASTANAIQFLDGSEFNSQTTENTPLLTISAPLGLQFGSHQGTIQVQAKNGLQIQQNQTLALVGGDIQLIGGKIKTNGGRLELGSIKTAGLVNITSTNQGFVLGYQDINNFGDITLTATSDVDSSGVGGGEIQIQTGNLRISEASRIASITLGALTGGDININATDTIEIVGIGNFVKKAENILNPTTNVFEGDDGFFILSVGAGSTGNLYLNTNKLILSNGAVIFVSAVADGHGGDMNINAAESIAVIESLLATGNRLESSGDAGNLMMNTRNLVLDNRGFIGSTSFGIGKAGNIQINALDTIELIPGEFLRSNDPRFADFVINTNINSSTLLTADAGNIDIKTQQLIIRENTLISASTLGTGKGGNLFINADDIRVFGNAAQVFGGLATASEIDATGDGGNLIINANNLQLQGGRISAGTVGIGKGGNLFINVNNLQIENGGQITASTVGAGKAGSLIINAGDIQINGVDINGFISGFFATSGSNATGAAGDIKINTDNLRILNQGKITVEALGTGIAGNLEIVASSIFLDNFSIISGNSFSNSTGIDQEQASINLSSQNLIMRHGSQITTNATGNNVIGGNITINVDVLAALENSDITANSTNFRGGNVMITSQGVIGTEFRETLTAESDITATGVSPELSGNVQINQLSTNPTQGLINLSSNFIDAENQLFSGCANGGKFANEADKLTIVGRGGLPSSPNDLLTAINPIVDLLELGTKEENTQTQQIKNPDQSHIQNSQTQIIEAQGWVRDAKGKIYLVASAVNSLPNSQIGRDNYCYLPE